MRAARTLAVGGMPLVGLGLLSALSGCRIAAREGPGARSELDPCGGRDHPCTLAGVTPDAHRRTAELADLLTERLDGPADLEAASAWLSQQHSVVSVATGPEAVRFRVRGGRGHWIFVQTAGAPSSLGAPGVFLARSASAGVGPAITPPRVTAAGPIKKALLLSPFRWQWEVEGGSDGIEEIAQALRARDYGEVTILTERLDPADPNSTTEEFGPSAFTIWDEYDYIHLVTHGARGCIKRKAPDSFDDALAFLGLGPDEPPALTEECLTAVATPWLLDRAVNARAQAESTGNPKLGPGFGTGLRDVRWTELLDRMGVETGKVYVWAPMSRVPQVGSGRQVMQEDIPKGEEHKPADTQQVRTTAGDFILLTSDFFRQTYKHGLDSAVVLISACSSGYTDDLLTALKGPHTAVIGWRDEMSLEAAAAAGTLIAKALVEVDETVEDDSGLTVEQASQRVRTMLEKVWKDPPSEWQCEHAVDPVLEAQCALKKKGRVLSVMNDAPAAALTGASLVLVGDSTIRAREIVYLVDAGGEELTPGGWLELVGLPGDRRADSAHLRIRVDGLELEQDPGAVDVLVGFEGREIAVERKLERAVARGVWELDHRLPLGRDVRTDEAVTLDAIARLPTGQVSRWKYPELRLRTAYWTMELAGARRGRYSGSGALASLGPQGIGHIGLTTDNAAPQHRVALTFDRGGPVTAPGVAAGGYIGIGLDLDKLNVGGADGFCTHLGGDPAYPPPPTVSITRLTDRYVSGTVAGFVYRCDPVHKPDERSRVQIEFVATICGPGTPGARPCRR